MGDNSITPQPINVIHCPLVDKMVCEVAAINATRSGYKYGNEDRRYRGKSRDYSKWVVQLEKTLYRTLQ